MSLHQASQEKLFPLCLSYEMALVRERCGGIAILVTAAMVVPVRTGDQKKWCSVKSEGLVVCSANDSTRPVSDIEQ